MVELYGWNGTIIKVDLTREKIVKEELSKDFIHKWIGGRGLGTKYLWEVVGGNVDPLSPENIFVYAAGPLVGTGVPQANKAYCRYKSPLTGHIGGGSVGDHLAKELKCAGYDAIIFYGRAKKPVYLWIDDDNIEIRDATHLWGKYVLETMKSIKEEVGDPNIKIGCIGPAGENLVRMASFRTGLMNAQGKTGGGAVLGSKNLKAFAIRGSKGPKIAHPDKFREYVREYIDEMKLLPGYALFSTYGTPGVVTAYYDLNMGNNFTENLDYSSADPDLVLERYITRLKACFGCPVHCKRFNEVRSEPYAGIGTGPDVSLQITVFATGITDQEFTVYIGDVVNEYGLDWWQSLLTIAWAQECYEKGILTKEDTDGLELKFGDKDVVEELVHRISRREGKIGNLLAEGSYLASKILGKGSEKYCVATKGLVGARDPRLLEANIMWWLTSNRGGDLQMGLPGLSWLGGTKEQLENIIGTEETNLLFSGDPHKYALGVAGLYAYAENWMASVHDSCGICAFVSTDPSLFDWFPKLFYTVTGWNVSAKDLMKIGERIYNLERAFTTRCGITRNNGYVRPPKFEEPDSRGRLIPKETVNKMLDHYFELRGWDLNTAVPTREKLESLDLREVADELEENMPYPEWEGPQNYREWYPDKYPRGGPSYRPKRVISH